MNPVYDTYSALYTMFLLKTGCTVLDNSLDFADIITSWDVSKDTGFQACHHGNIYNDLSQNLYLSYGLWPWVIC